MNLLHLFFNTEQSTPFRQKMFAGILREFLITLKQKVNSMTPIELAQNTYNACRTAFPQWHPFEDLHRNQQELWIIAASAVKDALRVFIVEESLQGAAVPTESSEAVEEESAASEQAVEENPPAA